MILHNLMYYNNVIDNDFFLTLTIGYHALIKYCYTMHKQVLYINFALK